MEQAAFSNAIREFLKLRRVELSALTVFRNLDGIER
jgi:hypothetical protein